MKIVVIGREGQLARSLVERAVPRRGRELITLSRPQMDLARPDEAAAMLARLAPDVVINAAAYTAVDRAEDEPELAHRINATAPGHLAAAAARTGARFIQISTDYVYPGTGEDAVFEDAETGPLSVYGRTKLAGEQAVRAECPGSVVVRTAWIYSVHGRNFVKTMMQAATTRDTLTVVADQFGNPSSASDLADGLLALLDRWVDAPHAGLGRTYHLAGTGTASWADFASRIMLECRRAGRPAAEIVPISTADWPTRATRPRNSRLDTSAFARDFSYRAPEWPQSTAEIVARLAG